jgi:putative SOS response-associated peptidase YedK
MCVQYLTTINIDWVKIYFDLDLPASNAHDVFPTYPGPIILKRHNTDRTAIGMARFGLLPSWAKEETYDKKTYNARVETVAEKPSYRHAWTKRHYALALADLFMNPVMNLAKQLVQLSSKSMKSLWPLLQYGIPGPNQKLVNSLSLFQCSLLRLAIIL